MSAIRRLIAMAVMFAMIVWAVLNWKAEWNYVRYVYTRPLGTVPLYDYLRSGLFFVGDIVITSAATGILGFGGLYGACGALFLSNMLSLMFFVPRRSSVIHNVPQSGADRLFAGR